MNAQADLADWVDAPTELDVAGIVDALDASATGAPEPEPVHPLRLPSVARVPSVKRRSKRVRGSKPQRQASSSTAAPAQSTVLRGLGPRANGAPSTDRASTARTAWVKRLRLPLLATLLAAVGIAAVLVLTSLVSSNAVREYDVTATAHAASGPLDPDLLDPEPAARSAAAPILPWDADLRAERVSGVTAAGLLASVDVGGGEVRGLQRTPAAAHAAPPRVFAASAGLFDSINSTAAVGRFFDSGHDARADRVVVLGIRAANLLGIARVDNQPAIFIGDRLYSVIGILESVTERPDLLDSVVLPMGTARADFELPAPDELHMRVSEGFGAVVADHVPVVLSPNDPQAITVAVPLSEVAAQHSVLADRNAIYHALGGVAIGLIAGLVIRRPHDPVGRVRPKAVYRDHGTLLGD